MDVAALVVSIVSVLVAIAAVLYARSLDAKAARAVAAAERSAGAAERSAAASERSATAGESTRAIEQQRRNAELTPRFRVTCERANPGIETLRLVVRLEGPPELGSLDALTVIIRDDHPWRGQGTPLAGGPTPEQVAEQIWGPYRFTPGTGPGADAVRGIPGADETGRSTPTGGMPVGEELTFLLEPTDPPRWSQQPRENWRRERWTVLRLQLECRREGRESWSLAGEVETSERWNFAEIP
jgi:hypothetical protein